jgi:hypothetical protein
LSIGPEIYISKKFDAGIREARRRALLRIRIEWCIDSIR